MLSLVTGGFAFHCLVPVAIESRYLAALIPGLLILAFFGIDTIFRSLVPAQRGLAMNCCSLLLVGGEGAFSAKTSGQMQNASAVILGASENNPFILVGSTTGGEGAITAEIATRDR